MLPAGSRLRTKSDFTAVLRGPGGTRVGNRLLVVHLGAVGARTGLSPRVGLVVSKAVGGAVVRNRVKRRLRAVCAAVLSQVPEGVDVVVRANPASAEATFRELAEAFGSLLRTALTRMAPVS